MQGKMAVAKTKIYVEQKMRVENSEEAASGTPLQIGDFVRYKLENSSSFNPHAQFHVHSAV